MASGKLLPRELFEKLLHTDTQTGVISILQSQGYWDDRSLWRYYGDRESNYNTAGNQQSRSDAALVEKLINSIDARLVNECLLQKIDPEGEEAPKTIREAVAQFFDAGAKSSSAGLIREWPDAKRNEIGKGIALAATGNKPSQGNPCFTIVDSGEGQTPDAFPTTLVSLDRRNKVKIPFVQGKFNMGGTGVLEFCGEHNLQLILSKRNPSLLSKTESGRDSEWGFTVVRRESPAGNERTSVYSYLAPLDVSGQPRMGRVLSFAANELRIFPEGNDAYARSAHWGTLIKLYEYSTVGFSATNIILRDGLLRQLDLLLNQLALPIRLYECRDYVGKKGSFETNLNGISVRLDDDKAGNLETEPSSFQVHIEGEKITGTIYVFQKGKHSNYKSSEGIIFSVNGQWHGDISKDFYRRDSVGMGILRDSILILLDCSSLSPRSRELLFMPSRDRLRKGELFEAIEVELTQIIKNHPELKRVREKRLREEKEALLDDDRPLGELLQELINESPTLSKLFIKGVRLSNPLNFEKTGEEEIVYKGEMFPTFFKLKESKSGDFLERICNIGTRPRIFYETDAVNSYFDRNVQPGTFAIEATIDGKKAQLSHTINLFNGIATLNLTLPETAKAGDVLILKSNTSDEVRSEPFVSTVRLIIEGPAQKNSGGQRKRRKPRDNNALGNREKPSGLALPIIVKVSRAGGENLKRWEEMDPVFDENSALRVINAGNIEENGQSIENNLFYVNIDNIHLNTEIKQSKSDPELLRSKYIYAQVLLGLAFINYAKTSKSDEDRAAIEEKMEIFSIAVSPVLLPMIQGLGELEIDFE